MKSCLWGPYIHHQLTVDRSHVLSATLLALLAEGKIKPVIAQRLPLEQIAYAHELLETSQVEGKIVLLPNESVV